MKNSASRETSQAVQPSGTVHVRIVLPEGAQRLGNWSGGEIIKATPEQAEFLVKVKGCKYVTPEQALEAVVALLTGSESAAAESHAVAPASADAAAAAAGEGGGASSTSSAE